MKVIIFQSRFGVYGGEYSNTKFFITCGWMIRSGEISSKKSIVDEGI